MKSKLKNAIKKIKNVYGMWKSRPLPQTDSELKQLVQEVLELGGFPENDSFSHAVASQIMHMDSQASDCRARNFIVTLKRSIANQVAFNMIEETKGRKAREKTVQATTAEVG